ncbi:RNase adapter RapZ [Candidatus Parabeggiatoa sp. HSG14]|uniref:RNase adapter RapZ n=1 Tax=Candidatus Parabeggiatoa sp. HSG14 TaxID=3055593 RepID=UPI0025A913A5|nr:RNase adapter RapZ [Thiotrichales bacterium HSG14]
MKLLIVSGLSGAGKTITLNSLEDMGVYCVDNLPIGLLPAFAEQANLMGMVHERVAIGVDARTITDQDMPALLQAISVTPFPIQVLFLEADDAVLIKRFSETRRKHPLTKRSVPLAEAIKHERQLLEPLASRADIRINTTLTHVHQLRDLIRLRVGLHASNGLSLLFQSFGFKYGLPNDADFVFDVRCLPNPHWNTELRSLTGMDKSVVNFLHKEPSVQQMREHLIGFLETWIPQFAANDRSYLTIAVGCTGGQHRSVYFVELLAQHFSQFRYGILVRHRELSVLSEQFSIKNEK